MNNALYYVTNGHTDYDKRFSPNVDLDDAYNQFFAVKQYYSKTSYNPLFHFIVSFSARSTYGKEYDRAEFFCNRIANYFSDKYPYYYRLVNSFAIITGVANKEKASIIADKLVNDDEMISSSLSMRAICCANTGEMTASTDSGFRFKEEFSGTSFSFTLIIISWFKPFIFIYTFFHFNPSYYYFL